MNSDAIPWLKPILTPLDNVLLQIFSQCIQQPKVQNLMKKSAREKNYPQTPQFSEYKCVRKVSRQKASNICSHECYHEGAHHRGLASVFIHPQIGTCNVEDRGLNAVTFLLQIIHSFVCSFGIFWAPIMF